MLSDRAEVDACGPERELITFSAGDQDFCVEVSHVREMRGWTPATLLPNSPAYVRGVINLRGTVLPIVDMSARLGMAAIEPSARHVIIVVAVGRKLLGLLVDAVCDIVTVSEAAIQATPELPCPTVGALVTSLIDLEGRVAGLLALEAILPPEAEVLP